MDSLSARSSREIERWENSEVERTSWVFQVPVEVIQLIFSQLYLQDLANVSRTCRTFHLIAKDNHLWKTLFHDGFIKVFKCLKRSKKDSWEINFKKHLQMLKTGCCFSRINLENPKGQKIYFHSLRNLTNQDNSTELKVDFALSLLNNVRLFDQNESIKTAKHLCLTYPELLAKHIKNFDIQDQTGLVDIAIEIGKTHSDNLHGKTHSNNLANFINNSGISGRALLIDIAMGIIEVRIANLFHKADTFNDKDRAVMIHVAKYLAKNMPELLATAIHRLHIQDQEDLIEIAEILLEKNPELFAQNIQNFFITSQKRLISFVKFFKKNYPRLLAENIQNFRIEDQQILIGYARLFAEKYPYILAQNLHKFDIQDQDLLIKLVKFLAKKVPNHLAKNIHNIVIKNQSVQIKIVKYLARKAPVELIENIHHLNIFDQKEWIKIIRRVAKKRPEELVQNIRNLDSVAKVWIANYLAKNNPILLAKNIHNFRLDSQTLIKITRFLAKKKPAILEKYKGNFNFGILTVKHFID